MATSIRRCRTTKTSYLHIYICKFPKHILKLRSNFPVCQSVPIPICSPPSPSPSVFPLCETPTFLRSPVFHVMFLNQFWFLLIFDFTTVLFKLVFQIFQSKLFSSYFWINFQFWLLTKRRCHLIKTDLVNLKETIVLNIRKVLKTCCQEPSRTCQTTWRNTQRTRPQERCNKSTGRKLGLWIGWTATSA